MVKAHLGCAGRGGWREAAARATLARPKRLHLRREGEGIQSGRAHACVNGHTTSWDRRQGQRGPPPVCAASERRGWGARNLPSTSPHTAPQTTRPPERRTTSELGASGNSDSDPLSATCLMGSKVKALWPFLS